MHRINMNPPLSFPYASKRTPFILQRSPKEQNCDEDLSTSLLGKSKHAHAYRQPTYYGNWGAAFFREAVLVHGTAVSGGTRARADCTHQMVGKASLNPYCLKTAERFFPASMLRTSDNRREDCKRHGLKGDSVHTKPLNSYVLYGDHVAIANQKAKVAKRKVCTSETGMYECRKTFYGYHKGLPKLEKAKEKVKRPMSGGVVKRKGNNETVADENEHYLKVDMVPRNRVSTAQAPRAPMAGSKPPPYRLSTPQTAPQKRPDSRYNKATLFTGLENGRRSPDYQVPIIDMRLEECAYHNSVMPSCWK